MTEAAEPEDMSGEARKPFQLDVALWIALVPVVGAALRVWLFSAGDTSVFLLLMRTLDIPSVLVGTTLLLGPTALCVGLTVAVTDWKAREWLAEVTTSHRVVTGLTGVFLIVLWFTVRWWVTWQFAGGMALVVGAYLLSKRFWPWGERHIFGLVVARQDSPRPDTPVTLLVVVILILGQPSTMWLPLEQVTDDMGDRHVAYVLESTEVWTTLLTLDREVSVFATGQIESRTLCRQMRGRTLAMIFADVNPAGADCSQSTVSE